MSDALRECTNAYIRALHREAMACQAWQDQDDAPPPSAVAHDVVVARLALYLCLIDSGWTPPPAVGEEIARDELLLSQAVDRWMPRGWDPNAW